MLEIAAEEVGGKLPIIHGVRADARAVSRRHDREAAQAGGASVLLVFPPDAIHAEQQGRHGRCALQDDRIGEVDLPLIVFQVCSRPARWRSGRWNRGTRLGDEVPTIRAIKDWTSASSSMKRRR